jgi:nucleoside-diphosphate-sugar epimerase
MPFNNRRDFPPDSLTTTEVIWVQTGTSGIFLLKEGTAPSTIANYAQIYAKSSDHLLYWKDSSGLERIVGSGSSMVYPGTGIPLSTGAGWDTSITDNSANWNIAYGWGNHASAGYLKADGLYITGVGTHKMTVGAVEPTNPAEGDIWIQI